MGWGKSFLAGLGIWLACTPALAHSECPATLAFETYRNAPVVDRLGRRLQGKLALSGGKLFFYPHMDEPIYLGGGLPWQWDAQVQIEGETLRLLFVELSRF